MLYFKQWQRQPRKFDAKVDEIIFLRYSSSSKAYRVFNHRIYVAKVFAHVDFKETRSQKTRKCSSSSLSVSCVLTEDLINNEIQKMILLKVRILNMKKRK